jgi:LAO/AO transport system kinase
MKAGLMEIGDVFCINKSDREGSDRAAAVLREALELKENAAWTPPVIKTIATDGAGIDELVQRIAEHRRFLSEQGLLERKRKERIESKIVSEVRARVWYPVFEQIRPELPSRVEQVYQTEMTPTEAVDEILGGLDSRS